MKRTIAALAMVVVLAGGALAQSNDIYSQNNPGPNGAANTPNTNTAPDPNATNTMNSNTTNDMNTTNTSTTNDVNNSNTIQSDVNTTDNTSNDMNSTTTDTNHDNLPATASPLGLLAISGLGMVGSGAWLIRRRRS